MNKKEKTPIFVQKSGRMSFFNNIKKAKEKVTALKDKAIKNLDNAIYKIRRGKSLSDYDKLPQKLGRTKQMPTYKDAARMADDVYMRHKHMYTGRWTRCKGKDCYRENSETSFQAQVYERDDCYVIAFAGTETDNINAMIEDIKHDVFSVVGLSEQFDEAIVFVRQWLSAHNVPKENITLVGHSLGGGLAAHCTYEFGIKAITFNALGVSELTKPDDHYSYGLITAFISDTDFLNIIMDTIPGNPLLKVADGIRYTVKNKNMGHGIKHFYE